MAGVFVAPPLEIPFDNVILQSEFVNKVNSNYCRFVVLKHSEPLRDCFVLNREVEVASERFALFRFSHNSRNLFYRVYTITFHNFEGIKKASVHQTELRSGVVQQKDFSPVNRCFHFRPFFKLFRVSRTI